MLFKVAENWYQIYTSLLNNTPSNSQQFAFNDAPPIWNPHYGVPNQHEFYNYPSNQFYNETQQVYPPTPLFNAQNNVPYSHVQQFYCQGQYPAPQINGRVVNAG